MNCFARSSLNMYRVACFVLGPVKCCTVLLASGYSGRCDRCFRRTFAAMCLVFWYASGSVVFQPANVYFEKLCRIKGCLVTK
jgi:hypothetical protein